MTHPADGEIPDTFLTSLQRAAQREHPYPHWLLDRCLPEGVADALIALPIAPPRAEYAIGRREANNDSRVHFGVENQIRYEVVASLARAFQSRRLVDALTRETGAPLAGTSLRIEYCQDTEGFWLEPHTDIGVKKFTMLIYLNREPEGAEWGTDIYSDKDSHFGRAPSAFNSALVFVPSDKTWHGFEKRPLNGVRKSLIVNYVSQEWRNRQELCFPDSPVG